jgi:RNA polymerase sigma-70 factor (ECF subfamily)
MRDAARIRPEVPGRAPRADADLLRSARAGDRDAFEALAIRAMPMLLGSALRLLRERLAAEEAVAEALFRALRRIEGFRGEAGFGTWTHRILCRVIADRFRSGLRERTRRDRLQVETRGGAVRLDASRPAPVGPRAAASREEEAERVRDAVGRLPARQRLVLVLHLWEGLSLREVAEVVPMRYATVKSNLHHARSALRVLLGDEDESAGARE